MRFSVVINTYNRGPSLRETLKALRYQTYPHFEVVVVNGPSTDSTEAVLDEFGEAIRRYRCPHVHLSKSRNIGIAAAAGDIVAFIDDDGIPEPRWLEELAAGYDAPDVGGVGGIVYDYTGYNLQFAASVCDRRATPVFDVQAPYTAYQVRGADPFVHLLGTNASFRRDALRAIGGFDEEFEYYLDETEICMRLNDFGYRVRLLDGAPVLHKFLASHLRNDKKALKKPYPVVKNKFYFNFRAAPAGTPVADLLTDGLRFVEKLTNDARWCWEHNRLTAAEFESFCRDVEAGIRDGLERGMNAKRKSCDLPPADPAAFRPYPLLTPAGKRLTVCFISQEYPPGVVGGVGRFTHELAHGMAAAGHEIHVVTRSDHHPTVDFEEGVWVHRVPNQTDGAWNSPELSPLARRVLGWSAAAHAEVKRVASTRPLDLVSAAVWDSEGLFCYLDDDLKSVLTLVTSLKTVTDVTPGMLRHAGIPELLDLERMTVQTAPAVVTPSRNVFDKVRKDYAAPAAAPVIPLGVRDRAADYRPRRTDGRVRVLSVGRLEPRKGIDLLLQAAATLCPEFPSLVIEFIGNDSIPIADLGGATYRDWFARTHAAKSWAKRVVFRGSVSEDELYQAYADCDIFVLPARFESFGLVLVEAMMFAKPTVGCGVGGMAEIIVDGVTGLLAYPNSAGSLTQCLRKLVADPTLRRRLGQAGRERFEAVYATDVMVRNTVQEYTRIAESFAA
jgi:glycosyltransferase involved in cell wall biosynthesis/GT2 family glycosyltransferase